MDKMEHVFMASGDSHETQRESVAKSQHLFHSYWLNGDAGKLAWGSQARYRALSPRPWSLMTGPSHSSDGMWLLSSLRKIQEWKAAA